MENKKLFTNRIEDKQGIYFKSCTTTTDDVFLMCNTGRNSIDNKYYVVTTNMLHEDGVPDECNDAKTFSELVAKLLNEYYNK